MSVLNATTLPGRRLVVEVDHDPTTTSTRLAKGSLIFYDERLFRKLTDGYDTNVVEIGPNLSQIYYVGKHGKNTNDGKSLAAAFLTFGAAITAASAQTPSSSNRFAIFCEDAGQYTESFTLPSWVEIFAENARFVGSYTINDDSIFCFGQAGNVSGTLFSKTSGSGKAIIKGSNAVPRTSGSFVNVTNGNLSIHVDNIEGQNSASVVSTSSGQIDIIANYIDVNGTGNCFDINSSGTINITANKLRSASGICIKLQGTSTVNAKIGEISGSTAYNVASGCTLNLFVAKISGTETNNGTANVSYAGNQPYQVLDTTGNQTISSAITLNLDSEDIANPAYSLASDEITFNIKGTYEISYNVVVDNTDSSGSARGTMETWVEKDSGSGYAAVNASYDREYIRETTQGFGCGTTFLLEVNSTDKIRVRVERINGTTTIDTTANKSHVSIRRLGT
jgi:hypothetical protein